MKPRPELPIEPLDALAWRRVEQKVLTETASLPPPAPPPGPGPWRLVAGMALAVASVTLAVAVWSHQAVVEAPSALAPTRVVTRHAGTRVALGEVRLEVGPASALVALGDDARGWEIVLSRGAVMCEVPPRRGRGPVRVLVDDVEVEVVGTRFEVRRDPLVAVRVERGVVRVRTERGTLTLRAGERWEAAPVAAAVAPAQAELAASPAPSEGPPVAAEGPAVETGEAADAPARPAPLDAQATFARASGLEASEADRAAALYARVEQGGGPWAANALYARGRLSAERGRHAESRALLSRYLRRHPDGLNAADARRLLHALPEAPE